MSAEQYAQMMPDIWVVTLQTNDTRRADKVWRWHYNASSQAAAKQVYHEPDEAFHLSLGNTRSRRHLLLHGTSQSTQYLLSLAAHEPTGESSSNSNMNISTCNAQNLQHFLVLLLRLCRGLFMKSKMCKACSIF